jgi:hypothetical protein
MAFDSHCTCLKSCASPRASAWLFACLIIPSFCLTFDVFYFALCTRLGLSHLLILMLIHCICGQPLDPTRTFIAPMVRNELHPMMLFIIPSFPSREMQGFMFHISEFMSFLHFLLIFLLVSWHHVIKWWHLHLGRCVHCRSHSNKFGFMHYFVSWDGNEDDNLGKETTLPQLAPNECVFFPCHKSFYCLHQQIDDVIIHYWAIVLCNTMIIYIKFIIIRNALLILVKRKKSCP